MLDPSIVKQVQVPRQLAKAAHDYAKALTKLAQAEAAFGKVVVEYMGRNDVGCTALRSTDEWKMLEAEKNSVDAARATLLVVAERLGCTYPDPGNQR